MRIAVISGSRAEWGLLRPLVLELSRTAVLTETDLFVTGSHLSTEHGETWRQIDYPIAEKIPCVLSDNTPSGIAISMGLATIGFGLAFERHRPDLVVVLGDRWEIFAAVAACNVARIPVSHIAGGEVTEGSYDDGFRHAITKMSHLHFTQAEEYRNRVIQLGENQNMVFNVGALGCDGLVKRSYPRERTNFFVMAHYNDRQALLEIEKELKDYSYMVVGGSHDVGSTRGPSMPRTEFLDSLRYADAIIGNSSAGIIEAPALGVPCINIGDRQRGRLMATSIIHCKEPNELPLALENLHSEFFQGIMASDYYMPYKGGNVAGKITDLILKHVGRIEVDKPFYQEW